MPYETVSGNVHLNGVLVGEKVNNLESVGDNADGHLLLS